MLKKIFIVGIIFFLRHDLIRAMNQNAIDYQPTSFLFISRRNSNGVAFDRAHSLKNIKSHIYKQFQLSSRENKEKFFDDKKKFFPIIIGTSIAHYDIYKYWPQHDNENERMVEKVQRLDTDLIPERSKSKVLLLHIIRRGGNLESVRKHGLLTLNELYKRGLTDHDPSRNNGLMSDQHDVIYFSYNTDVHVDNANYVQIEVDPDSTYVYNREFRYINKPHSYYSSKALLRTYIENKEKAEEMRRVAPLGKVVIFDPLTSMPFYVDSLDLRFSSQGNDIDVVNSIYLYLGEIIFHQKSIPPEELIFPDVK